jgi:hypothetical protein
LLKKGFFNYPLDIVIGSGLLLADDVSFSNYNIKYVKTYIPLKMLKERQDNIHEEAWEEILEERKNQKVQLPLI